MGKDGQRALPSSPEWGALELDCWSSNPSLATYQLCALGKSLTRSVPQFPHLQIAANQSICLIRAIVRIKLVHVYETLRTVLGTLAICYYSILLS